MPSSALWHTALGILAIAFLVRTPTLLALEARVPRLRIVGGWLEGVLELSDAFTPALREKFDGGASLYLRVQARLWEDRPLWDRQVGATAVSVFRLVRNPRGGRMAVIDDQGGISPYPAYPASFEVEIRIVNEGAIAPDGHYYLEVETTLGSIDERVVDEAGRAIFGNDEGGGVGRIGRFLLSTVLQVTDYLQGSSAHTKSRTFDGSELRGT